MKEIGADSLFAPSGLPVPISSNCKRWLLDVELDLSNSLTTLEAVQWAICELQRMELQERYSALEAHLDQGKADADADAEQKGDCRKGPTRCEQGSEDPALGNRSGIQSELGKRHGEEPIDNSTRRATRQQQTEQLEEVRRWRTLFQTTGKRKSHEEDSGGENGKRMKKDPAVCEVDHAETGKRMAKRIGARLGIPDCISLTNLISHCLLVSIDQVPPIGMEVQLGGSTCAAAEAASGSKTHKQGFGVSISDDWLWLHKWLVKTCLFDVGDDDSFASLDWLIALMTAACQSLIEPILDDLVLD